MHNVLSDLTLFEACSADDPGLAAATYSCGAAEHDRFEVATQPTSRTPGSDPRVQLGPAEVDLLVRAWVGDLAAGRDPGQVPVHDGAATIVPTRTDLLSVAVVDERFGWHLCCLDDDTDVLVIDWRAEPATELPPPSARPSEQVGRTLGRWFEPAIGGTVDPAIDGLLSALSPEDADLDRVSQLARIGTTCAQQAPLRVGAPAELAHLRTLVAFHDDDVTTLQARARDVADTWARLLWPPDHHAFDRRHHQPSTGLRHALEATVLALHLYPDIPVRRLNAALTTTMWLLTGGEWGQQGIPVMPASTNLCDRMRRIQPAAWASLAEQSKRYLRTGDHVQVHHAFAATTGWGVRPPDRAVFLACIPGNLPRAARDALSEVASQAAMVTTAGLIPFDPLSTYLAGPDGV